MRLFSYQIIGFRSIIDTDVCKISELDNIVVLAGQNEAGKTAVLEALDFFRNGPSKRFLQYQKRTGSDVTEVFCTFKLDTADLRHDQITKNHDQLSKFIQKNPYLTFYRRRINDLVGDIQLTDESIELISSLLPPFKDETISQEAQPSVKSDSPSEKSEAEDPTPVTTDTPVVEAASDTENTPSVEGEETSNKEAEVPVGAALNPVDAEKELSESYSKSVISSIPPFSFYTNFSDLLPSEQLVTELGNSNAIRDFEKVFSVNLEEYAQISDPRELAIKITALEQLATDDFNQSWSQTITSIGGEEEYSFSIVIDNAEPKK